METEVANPTNLLLLRREVQLERRMVELRRDSAIYFYRPHEKQYQFHSSADYRFRHPRYGNQIGKTMMGAAEDVAFALGYRPWMEQRFPIINGRNEVVAWHEGYKGHPFATLGIPPHPTKGLVICADWDKSKELFTEQEGEHLGYLIQFIPKDRLGQPTRNHSGAIDRIPVKHKSDAWSMIHLDTVKSYKQNPKGSESSIWDWIHIDEPCPEPMFKANARGLMARNGRAWLPLTPLEEPWIQEMFSPNLSSELDDVGKMVYSDRIMFTASMYDNPYLSEEGREAYIALLTEDEKECRVQGIPTAYAGLVYKEFRWDVHVRREPPVGWKSWTEPPGNFCLRFAIDYHPRKPHHVLFIATSPQDRHYVYEEIFRSCLMSELVADIKAVFHGREPDLPGLIDPLADTPNRVTDITSLEEVLRLGLAVMPATKDPHNGILRVKEFLKQRDRVGQPMMVFNSNLPRTLMEISRGYVWDGETNKPLKDKDDAMENLYRLCLQGLTYVEPSKPTDYIPSKIPDELNSRIVPFEFAIDDKPKRGFQAARYRR